MIRRPLIEWNEDRALFTLIRWSSDIAGTDLKKIIYKEFLFSLDQRHENEWNESFCL